MPGVQPFLTTPLHYVDQTFFQHVETPIGQLDRDSSSFSYERVKIAFGELVQSFEDRLATDKWPTIPSLNDVGLDELSDGQLVRFRGMLQDVCDKEMYLASFEVRDLKTGTTRIETGRYREEPSVGKRDEILISSPKTIKMERRPYICTSVPGETAWARAIYRVIGLDRTSNTDGVTYSEDAIFYDCEEEYTDDNDTIQVPEVETSKSFVIKLYDSPDEVNLNDLVQIIGVISFDNDEGKQVDKPKSLESATIHVIRLVQLQHNNPLLPIELTPTVKSQVMQDSITLRGQLLDFLTKALLGDILAAEYLLFHLISKIYVRRDRLCLGKLSLNIFNLPQGVSYGRKLCSFLKELLSKAVYLPVTEETLNSDSLLPRADIRGNRLLGGPLQLPPSTHLFLDETDLVQRDLTEQGRANVEFLRKLIDHQKVDFNCQGDSPLECPVDVPCLVLSHNSSILSSDVQVILEPTVSYDATGVERLFSDLQAELDSKEILSGRFRQYLTVSQLSKYEVPDEMQKFIQAEIVRSRRIHRIPSLATEELHTQLVLSRFLILSRGQTDLTPDAWEEARNLELHRKQRFERRGRTL